MIVPNNSDNIKADSIITHSCMRDDIVHEAINFSCECRKGKTLRLYNISGYAITTVRSTRVYYLLAMISSWICYSICFFLVGCCQEFSKRGHKKRFRDIKYRYSGTLKMVTRTVLCSLCCHSLSLSLRKTRKVQNGGFSVYSLEKQTEKPHHRLTLQTTDSTLTTKTHQMLLLSAIW